MDYTKEKQKITDLVHSTLYHELYDYIQNAFDVRPSTTKKVIETLTAVIESLVNDIEKSGQKTENLKPFPETIDVLY